MTAASWPLGWRPQSRSSPSFWASLRQMKLGNREGNTLPHHREMPCLAPAKAAAGESSSANSSKMGATGSRWFMVHCMDEGA